MSEDKCEKFRQSLRLTDPLADLESIRRTKGEEVKGTCEWLLFEDKYVAWAFRDKPQLLRLQGGPGIGKTMISSFLVGKLEEEAREDSAVTLAYYFCDNKDESRNTASALLRGLLLQLLRKRPVLFQKHVEEFYDEMKNRLDQLFKDLDILWRIFRSMLKDHDAGKVYVLLDALDECEKSSRQAFLTHLEKLFAIQQLDGNLNIKFLITCRPEQEIEDTLRDVGECLRMDSFKINSDLSNFIDVKVDDLCRRKVYPTTLKHDIKVALTDKAGGTFLWASLVLDDISKAKTARKAREMLQVLPSSLSEVYNRILNNIEDEYRKEAILILRWVVIARRPLTVHELAMARALALPEWENKIPPADTLEELKDDFRICEPLLYRDTESDTINLVHQSAKDYLLGEDLQKNGKLSQYRVAEDKTNLFMFQTCWRYLSSEEFDHGSKIISRNDNRLCREYLSDQDYSAHKLLHYAVHGWEEHALNSRLALRTDFKWESITLGKAPTLRDTWLFGAVSSGQEEIVELLLDKGADVNYFYPISVSETDPS